MVRACDAVWGRCLADVDAAAARDVVPVKGRRLAARRPIPMRVAAWVSGHRQTFVVARPCVGPAFFAARGRRLPVGLSSARAVSKVGVAAYPVVPAWLSSDRPCVAGRRADGAMAAGLPAAAVGRSV